MEPWVSDLATGNWFSYVVAQKARRGSRSVEI